MHDFLIYFYQHIDKKIDGKNACKPSNIKLFSKVKVLSECDNLVNDAYESESLQ